MFASLLKFDPNQPRDAQGQWSKTAASARTIEREMEAFQSDPANSRREISAAINRTTGEILFRNDVPYEDTENPRAGGVDDSVYHREMDDAGDGNVLHYHTHPDDNAFSDGDWKVFAWSHIGEMRVVTSDHVYTLVKTPKWDESDWKTRYPAKMEARWNELSDELWDSTYAFHGEGSVSGMVAELTRRINQKMAEEFGVTFTVRPRQSIAQKFAEILKFDESKHPRDKAGKFKERGAIDQKRRDFMALVKRADREEIHLDRMRAGMAEAWKVWGEDLKNHRVGGIMAPRKKPLVPDGAAAKKLESFKQARRLEEAFHARYEAVYVKKRALDRQARAMLRVPEDQRSSVTFKDDPKTPPLHPLNAKNARSALETFRQFDGSGALVASKFPAGSLEKFKEMVGDQIPIEQNPDGSYSIPVSLTLGKSASSRAHATMTGINIGGGNDVGRQVYHEVAHHIEMRSHAVLQAAIAFRESKAIQPRQVYNLNEGRPALADDEKALRGDFPDPYTGKIYPNDIATEIVSTGVESYMDDPVRFARDRTDHFNFIFDVMHGKYRDV